MEAAITILLFGALLWFWWDSLGAMEVATHASRLRCQRFDIQFLDDTVALDRIRPCRHAKGHMQLCREYRFEFSSDGQNRLPGRVFLKGQKVARIELAPYPESQDD